MTKYIELFLSFFKIGMTSFGGTSMIPLINAEMLGHGWMTGKEVADIVAIAEMTPGPLGLNCATFAGIRVGGIFGAVCANAGTLFPTYTIAWVVAAGFEKFKDSKVMQNALYGIRPICIGLILYAMLTLSRTNYLTDTMGLYWQPILIGLVAVYLLVKQKWSVPRTILLSAVLGILIVR